MSSPSEERDIVAEFIAAGLCPRCAEAALAYMQALTANIGQPTTHLAIAAVVRAHIDEHFPRDGGA